MTIKVLQRSGDRIRRIITNIVLTRIREIGVVYRKKIAK